MAVPEYPKTYRTRSSEGNLLNSPPHPLDGSMDSDICLAGVGHVRDGLPADDMDAREAAACMHRRLELEAARAELELRREGGRELVLRHKLWRQNGTVVLAAALMAVIAVRSDLAAPALLVLFSLSGLITKVVFDDGRAPAEQVAVRSAGGLR